MLGDYNSKSIETNCGTLQGAILSTTIFNILIADIQLHTSATITGYADHTTATIIAENQAKLNAAKEKEEEEQRDRRPMDIRFRDKISQMIYGSPETKKAAETKE